VVFKTLGVCAGVMLEDFCYPGCVDQNEAADMQLKKAAQNAAIQQELVGLA